MGLIFTISTKCMYIMFVWCMMFLFVETGCYSMAQADLKLTT